MSDRWLGIVIGKGHVIAVDAAVPDSGPITIQSDDTWHLQDGNPADAYRVMHQHVADYVKENGIKRVAIQASALPRSRSGKEGEGSPKLGLLTNAELRGVVASAAACNAETVFVKKATTSRTFGERNVDDYLKDDGFWSSHTTGEMRKGSRAAAMMLLAIRKKEAAE